MRGARPVTAAAGSEGRGLTLVRRAAGSDLQRLLPAPPWRRPRRSCSGPSPPRDRSCSPVRGRGEGGGSAQWTRRCLRPALSPREEQPFCRRSALRSAGLPRGLGKADLARLLESGSPAVGRVAGVGGLEVGRRGAR